VWYSRAKAVDWCDQWNQCSQDRQRSVYQL